MSPHWIRPSEAARFRAEARRLWRSVAMSSPPLRGSYEQAAARNEFVATNAEGYMRQRQRTGQDRPSATPYQFATDGS